MTYSKSSNRKRTYSKSSKRERERTYSKSSKRERERESDGVVKRVTCDRRGRAR